MGAGFSKAFGLPSTQELLSDIPPQLGTKLDKAYKHFYPIESAGSVGFRPNVVDFFSLLQSHIAIASPEDGPAFPANPLANAAKLYRELKWFIARKLITGAREQQPLPQSDRVDKMFRPGNVIITSNWDMLVEIYGRQHGLRFSYRRLPMEPEVPTLLKLHGSVDWLEKADRKGNYSDGDYAPLRERVGGRSKQISLRGDEQVLRARALERDTRVWQWTFARSQEPLMITMAQGKASELAPLRAIWNDAYWAMSAAKHISFIGYSLPQDDVEIRALILAGIGRGRQTVNLRVQNPAPDVHERFRTYIRRRFDENYSPFMF